MSLKPAAPTPPAHIRFCKQTFLGGIIATGREAVAAADAAGLSLAAIEGVLQRDVNATGAEGRGEQPWAGAACVEN